MRGCSRVEFEQRFVATRTPVIVEDATAAWPAHAKWSMEYLRTFADYPFHSRAGTQTFGAFLDAALAGETYADFDLFQLPALLTDVVVPPLVEADKIARSLCWMGSATRFGLHYDEADNLHALVRGRKTFLLIAPREYPNLYPVDARRDLKQGINWSQVDPFAPDLERFPNFRQVEMLRAQLSPGDTLYLPAFFWHAVEHEGRPSIAVNFWWANEHAARVPAELAFFGDRLLLADFRRHLGDE